MNNDVIDATFREAGTAVAVRQEPHAVETWTPRFAVTVDEAVAMVNQKREFFRRVMKEGVHYGTIPGTDKPALWKPGAELLLSSMGMMPEGSNEAPPILDVMGTDHGGEPFILYERVCRIYRHNNAGERVLVAQEGGSCNSWEAKYRYRNAKRVCPSCGAPAIIKGKQEYGGGWLCFKKQDGCGAKFRDGDASIESQEVGKVANEEMPDLINTIKKMGAKRALIAATLLATGCSDIFTQDMEAQTGEPPPDEPLRPSPRAPSPSQPSSAPRGMTKNEAAAAKATAGGACVECHAPSGKPHATACPHKRSETWDAEARARDTAPPAPPEPPRAQEPAPQEQPVASAPEGGKAYAVEGLDRRRLMAVSHARAGALHAMFPQSPHEDAARHAFAVEVLGDPRKASSLAWTAEDYRRVLAALQALPTDEEDPT